MRLYARLWPPLRWWRERVAVLKTIQFAVCVWAFVVCVCVRARVNREIGVRQQWATAKTKETTKIRYFSIAHRHTRRECKSQFQMFVCLSFFFSSRTSRSRMIDQFFRLRKKAKKKNNIILVRDWMWQKTDGKHSKIVPRAREKTNRKELNFFRFFAAFLLLLLLLATAYKTSWPLNNIIG